jgi:hypothetical protein
MVFRRKRKRKRKRKMKRKMKRKKKKTTGKTSRTSGRVNTVLKSLAYMLFGFRLRFRFRFTTVLKNLTYMLDMLRNRSPLYCNRSFLKNYMLDTLHIFSKVSALVYFLRKVTEIGTFQNLRAFSGGPFSTGATTFETFTPRHICQNPKP